MRWLVLLVLVGCKADPEYAPLVRLEVGGIAMDVDSGRRFFAVSADELGAESRIVAKAGDPDARVTLRWETATGAAIETRASHSLALEEDQRVVIRVDDGEQKTAFLVSVTPPDLPPIEATGTPTEHFVFLAPRDWVLDDEEAPYGHYLLIVDGRGTPVWWLRTGSTGFDFRVAGDGRLTANAAPVGGDFGNLVIDPTTGALDARYDTLGEPAHWEDLRVDTHEFSLRADGSVLRTIKGSTVEDTSALGGLSETIMWHCGVEEVARGGDVLARWTTEGNIDLAALPDHVWGQQRPDTWWRYAHINSAQDMSQGWLLSLRAANQAVLVDPVSGAYRWKVGGADSDVVFVDDPRGGFVGQHSVRMFEPDRLTVFDNGTNLGSDPTGPSRAVEYALDLEAGTATMAWEYVLDGASLAHFGGNVQRTADGGTVIGWGSIQEQNGERAPSVTILGADRQWESELRLPAGMYTYRAYLFAGDPIRGVWKP